MSTQDTTTAKGSRFRHSNDRETFVVQENNLAPEWGGTFTCVAC